MRYCKPRGEPRGSWDAFVRGGKFGSEGPTSKNDSDHHKEWFILGMVSEGGQLVIPLPAASFGLLPRAQEAA